MISCIKNNPIKFILAVLLTIILSLNYFGYCYSQKRFLSDEEKLNIVVKYILTFEVAMSQENSEYIERVKLVDKDKGQKLQLEKDQQGEYVPYHNIEDFFALNPSCCQVTTNYKSIGGEGDTVSCWNRLTGFKSSVVGVRYLSRYRNSEGTIQSKPREIFPGVNNCGELVWELG